jgi:hypothetical protein
MTAMQKIPTLLERDFTDPRHPVLTDRVKPGCEWVLAGEGVATRKYDGTCVALLGQIWWARREVKAGKVQPDGFMQIGHDPETGKTIGWEPAEQSAFWKYLQQALEAHRGALAEGTYELVGPRVNGNPERVASHALVRHDDADHLDIDTGTVEAIKASVLALADPGIEGVVWHHPDGRMAKLKVRDLR